MKLKALDMFALICLVLLYRTRGYNAGYRTGYIKGQADIVARMVQFDMKSGTVYS